MLLSCETYEFLAQNARRVLDLLADEVKILADIVRVLVRGLVKEDAFHVDAVARVVFRPAAVDAHIFKHLLDRPLAILHPYVAHGRHIFSRVEEWQFARVVGVRRWGLAGTAIGIDYDQEVQIWVIVDAVGWWQKISRQLDVVLQYLSIVRGNSMTLQLICRLVGEAGRQADDLRFV